MTRHTIVAEVRDRRGRLISKQRNSYEKTHPIQAHFAKMVGKPDAVYLHAEIAALLACGKQRPYSIYVERRRRDGTLGMAKPCIICQAAIKAWGVRNVFYSE